MSGIWFTADLHLGHTLLAGLRGFGEDTAAHDAEIARRWDFLVKPQDQVWVLGDLCIGRGRSHHAALDWIGERPGIKHLIFGNHDSGHPMHREAHKVQAEYFRVFASAQQSGMRKIAGQRVILSHFPYATDHTETARYPEWRVPNHGQWLLHGHTHSAEKRTSSVEIHVGLDAHGLSPVPIKWVEHVIARAEDTRKVLRDPELGTEWVVPRV